MAADDMTAFLYATSSHPVLKWWPVSAWKDLFRALDDLGWRIVRAEP